MPSTSPDSIYYPDISAAQNQPGYMGTHATSVQVALSARQRYTYVWANATARTAQAGMTEGSVGYQLDTKTEYKYENGVWRLATPHAEFTSTTTVNNTTTTQLGTFTLDSTRSTSTNFVTPGGTGFVNIADPGIYSVSSFSSTADGTPMSGRSFLDLATTADDSGILQRISINVGENAGSISMPNLRTVASPTSLYFKMYQTTGASRSIPTRIRITRLG